MGGGYPVQSCRARSESAAQFRLPDGVTEPQASRSHGFGAGPDHRIDKAVAGVGMPLPARLQHMAQQKTPGQRKAIATYLLGPVRRTRLVVAKEGRQPQQPVVERRAGQS